MLNVLLSIIVGVGSGIALAYFIEYLDTSVKTVEDVERFMGVPVLGVIPQKVMPLNDEDADAAHAEAYRILRTNIRFSKRLEDGRAITITSGSASEGKSLTLFNLAYVSARLGERVLIVDSDLHRPTQHKILGLPRDRGLANVLVTDSDVASCIVETNIANLDLMPSGKLPSGHHGLLDSLRMKELVTDLKSRYDLVLFDSPPITGVSDASLLAREMDGVLLVIQHRKHPKAVSNRARAMIENVGGNLVGVVLNNINISKDYSYYYYGHYYSYSYAKPRDSQPAGKGA
jgi:capsular exopolysaccharide synthesis family protein